MCSVCRVCVIGRLVECRVSRVRVCVRVARECRLGRGPAAYKSRINELAWQAANVSTVRVFKTNMAPKKNQNRTNCAAFGCSNRRDKTGLSFFRFPKDPERYVLIFLAIYPYKLFI